MAVPVITVDGPSGAGKGTVSLILACHLGFHYLDSGALYRALAVAATRHQINVDHVEALAVLAAHMDVAFVMGKSDSEPRVVLEGEDVTAQVRAEETGAAASRIAAMPAVRGALLRRQRAFAKDPGLVADGRDMGTVVFPDAQLKVFLTASPEERAQRRHKQLIEKGETATLADLAEAVRVRDARDSNREVAPLRPADDALYLDSTGKAIEEVVAEILAAASERMAL